MKGDERPPELAMDLWRRLALGLGFWLGLGPLVVVVGCKGPQGAGDVTMDRGMATDDEANQRWDTAGKAIATWW